MAWHGMALRPTPPVPSPIVGTPLRPPVKVLRRSSGDCDQGLKNTAPAHAKAQDVHPDPPPSSVPPPPLVGCPSRTLGSHTTGSRHALCLGAPRCLDQPRHMPGAAAVYTLAHHRQQLGHRASRCLDQMPRDMPMVREDVSTSIDLVRRTASGHASTWAGNCLGHHRHQQGLGACGWLYEKSVPISDTRCYGHLPRTPSAVTLTWSARIPRTASAHALRCYR